MNANGKSDIGIVPEKESNKIMRKVAETLEERPVTKGKPDKPTVTRTQCRGQTLSGLARIRERAE